MDPSHGAYNRIRQFMVDLNLVLGCLPASTPCRKPTRRSRAWKQTRLQMCVGSQRPVTIHGQSRFSDPSKLSGYVSRAQPSYKHRASQSFGYDRHFCDEAHADNTTPDGCSHVDKFLVSDSLSQFDEGPTSESQSDQDEIEWDDRSDLDIMLGSEANRPFVGRDKNDRKDLDGCDDNSNINEEYRFGNNLDNMCPNNQDEESKLAVDVCPAASSTHNHDIHNEGNTGDHTNLVNVNLAANQNEINRSSLVPIDYQPSADIPDPYFYHTNVVNNHSYHDQHLLPHESTIYNLPQEYNNHYHADNYPDHFQQNYTDPCNEEGDSDYFQKHFLGSNIHSDNPSNQYNNQQPHTGGLDDDGGYDFDENGGYFDENGSYNDDHSGFDDGGGFDDDGGFDNDGGLDDGGGFDDDSGFDNDGGFDDGGGFDSGGCY
ncbi:hypothetical protein PGT21_035061 [Puccinia graminis f. sp. tritici]|uniref:Uncharacterized protein n=1 Tax=Puccinia graminis f. sp. tritici TaxID=56615 RepID=A0A5B0QQ64_PUCGR|nr:hypothetical protein PGT21_035061 [Puccinia graminis f. sp. tritici]